MDHPNYVMIWFWLLLLLTAGIVFGMLGNHWMLMVLVYGVAVVKAFVVLRYFMHMNLEPRYITVMMVGSFSCIVVLFLLLLPDIVYR